MASILRQRRDTAANWAANNPVIPDGQLCFDTTNNIFKIGNGVSNYSDLPVLSGVAGTNGVGIASITRTMGDGSAGTTDTYTITYTDSRTDTFTVYNGANGGAGHVIWDDTSSAPQRANLQFIGATVTDNSSTDTTIVTINANYSLPTASATTLGGVKVDGTTIAIDANGVISSTAGAPQKTTVSENDLIPIYDSEDSNAPKLIKASVLGVPTITINNIGVAGEVGFGVGIAPAELVSSFGLTPMSGYNNPAHPNYGNYTDASGSVMVYIPKHYVKLSHETATPYLGLRVDISPTPQEGYSLPRCFINNGVEVAGIFVDKYLMGREGNVGVSKRNLDPVSMGGAHNPISNLTANNQTPQNRYDGMYAAVKTRGANYSLTTIFTYTMLANLADAHYQACYQKNYFSSCAWADVAPYQPKGCNNNALKDVNDASVVYTASGYQNCGLTGGVSDAVFAKIAHNGQKCGVVDLNGNMWEVAAGYITSSAGAHLVLKESIDVKNLTAAAAYTTTNYDALTMPLTLNNTQVSFGNGTNQFFSGDTLRTSNAYRLDNLGLPLNDNAVSTSGTNRFGQDGFWRYQANEMCPIVGGGWNNSGLSGVRTRVLGNVRSSSHYNVGGRACLVPSVAG